MKLHLIKLAAWSIAAVAILITLPFLPLVWLWTVMTERPKP